MGLTDAQRVQVGAVLWEGLEASKSLDREVTASTVRAWMEDEAIGYPDVPLFPEQVRRVAVFWADLADPEELDAYLLAAANKSHNYARTSKQIKIMLAKCVGLLNDSDKVAFGTWLKGQ